MLVSISSTFYEQLLRQYPCAENLQSQTASTKILWRKIIGAKAAHKMLMKLTPGWRGVRSRTALDLYQADITVEELFPRRRHVREEGEAGVEVFPLLLFRDSAAV